MIKNDVTPDALYEGWEEGNVENKCSSKIIRSTTMPNCNNYCKPPYVKTPHPFVAKVPVVKKICNINVNVKSRIRLEKYASDIKDIDKEICLTQCTLCPIYTPCGDYKWQKYQLFLEGYVKKNIRYCHPTCEPMCKRGCESGEVLCTTCKIPFECSTTIVLPSGYGKKPEPKYKEEFESLGKCNKLCKDPNKKHLICHGSFAEGPYCELINYVISECDFVEKPRCKDNFKTLEEKMVVSITLRIMQNEEMFIKNQPPKPCKEETVEYCETEMHEEPEC